MKGAFVVLGTIAVVVIGFAMYQQQATQVLMVGNSYTYGNDLGGMIKGLGDAGGNRVNVTTRAVGGWWLEDHAASADTVNAIESTDWDYVILQEQSIVPASEPERINSMNPSMRALNRSIQIAGASPVLYLTWGRRGGFSDVGHASYASMQAAVTSAYEKIADELGAVVAPVGEAWRQVLIDHPGLTLYQSDGSHPTRSGTYLAACVFYAALFEESPEGLEYTGGLGSGEAAIMQRIAAETVLQDPTRWHLPDSVGSD
jgi:hypothetical protein